MRGKIYVSGPMSGIDDANYPLFNKVAGELRDAGWEVINPAEFEPEGWEDIEDPGKRLAIFLREDFALLATCDSLVLLPGWADSTGANCELFLAQQIGLTTYVWLDGLIGKEPHLYANLDTIIDHINAVQFPGEEA